MMSRPVVLYLLAIAFIFLISSRSPSSGSTSTAARHPRSRRLARHLDFTFDPLITELEERAEEGGVLDFESFKRRLDAMWEKQDWSRMNDEIGFLEEYFGDEGRLNLTERLTYLFPLLDRFPQDGAISHLELQVWLQRQAMDRLLRQTRRKMEAHDRDGNGAVSLQEFLAYDDDDSLEEIDWRNKVNGQPGWWREQFSNADSDGDGALNASEFNDFLHPEDSLNPKITLWLLKEKMKELDQNNDGALNLKEFKDVAFGIYRGYVAYYDDRQIHMPDLEEEFQRLDLNKDKFLAPEELKPLIHLLYPGEISQAIYFTKYLMDKADENKDGKLTLKEMMEQQYAFYSTVYEEFSDGYDEDYDYHSELRR